MSCSPGAVSTTNRSLQLRRLRAGHCTSRASRSTAIKPRSRRRQPRGPRSTETKTHLGSPASTSRPKGASGESTVSPRPRRGPRSSAEPHSRQPRACPRGRRDLPPAAIIPAPARFEASSPTRTSLSPRTGFRHRRRVVGRTVPLPQRKRQPTRRLPVAQSALVGKRTPCCARQRESGPTITRSGEQLRARERKVCRTRTTRRSGRRIR